MLDLIFCFPLLKPVPIPEVDMNQHNMNFIIIRLLILIKCGLMILMKISVKS